MPSASKDIHHHPLRAKPDRISVLIFICRFLVAANAVTSPLGQLRRRDRGTSLNPGLLFPFLRPGSASHTGTVLYITRACFLHFFPAPPQLKKEPFTSQPALVPLVSKIAEDDGG
jgi:hypothetical protein